MGLKSIGSVLGKRYGQLKTETRHCEMHGSYTAQSIFAGCWTRCPMCAKQEMAEEMADYAEKLRVEAKQAEAVYRIGRAGIAPRYAACSVENFVVDENIHAMARAKAVAADYADNFDSVLQSGRCLIFSGLRGTGKNHLACGIANQIISDGYSAVVIAASDMLQTIKASYSGGSEMEALKAFVLPDLLVLDEFGMGTQSETEARLLFTVINRRYELMKPTMVLTNLSPQEFVEKVDARIRDRLRDNGGKLVPFNWESCRS
ncbi:DNA replication protein [Neisseria weixii]|uniref:DNA replication protein n=1 Tax=Neisseria weixii TaxID=1853276 RepID=A0A3N4MZF5_9NEIS|nr:ATP-binding protein [Neisseria weixii]RPD86298.1 DNA replication protein [Neisseria weixii]RPD89382.1 DNA replication protein [Neisseria weixii]